MNEIKGQKERLSKINELLDRLDEKLAQGDITEAKYRELSGRYKAEADGLKNLITEKELMEEVGLRAEEKEEEIVEYQEEEHEKIVYKEPEYENKNQLLMEKPKSNFPYKTAGIISAVISLFLLPPVLGILSIYCGYKTYKHESGGWGIAIMVVGGFFMLMGMIIGAYVWGI